MVGPNRLNKITEEAATAFWKSVEQSLPDLNVEKLDAGVITLLQWHMKSAIEMYVQNNVTVEDDSDTMESVIPNDKIAYSVRKEICFICQKPLQSKWYSCQITSKPYCDEHIQECFTKHGKNCNSRVYKYINGGE